MYEYGITDSFQWICRIDVENPGAMVEIFVDKFQYGRNIRWSWSAPSVYHQVDGRSIKFMPLEEFLDFSTLYRQQIEAKGGQLSKFKFSDFMQSVL